MTGLMNDDEDAPQPAAGQGEDPPQPVTLDGLMAAFRQAVEDAVAPDMDH